MLKTNKRGIIPHDHPFGSKISHLAHFSLLSFLSSLSRPSHQHSLPFGPFERRASHSLTSFLLHTQIKSIERGPSPLPWNACPRSLHTWWSRPTDLFWISQTHPGQRRSVRKWCELVSLPRRGGSKGLTRSLVWKEFLTSASTYNWSYRPRHSPLNPISQKKKKMNSPYMDPETQ